jgi:ABC-type polysaccharide/polyol phosphate transport system ATPase subunit
MQGRVSIEARHVHKSFRVPAQRALHMRKERVRHPIRSRRARTLPVLEDVSFDVHEGEFFGVVGRNGSGKSTLLKLLASVYRLDGGTIRIGGRLAPFLELGVGFNQTLPAYENVILNGVMMGLRPETAKARFEEIIDFAGLGEYTDLTLKNYSSGMKVRLGFSVMTHVDADLFLIDEVLAVGDAAFQEKCEGTFRQMQADGRTIILVTHSMPSVIGYCDRAMLLDEGRIAAIGDPLDVSNRYLEVNMRALAASAGDRSDWAARFAEVLADPPVRIVDAWLSDSAGRRTEVLSEREPIEVHAVVEVDREIEQPAFMFHIDNSIGRVLLSGGPSDLGLDGGRAMAGQRFRLKAAVDNHFGTGRYSFSCGVFQGLPDGSSEPASAATSLNFDVKGSQAEGMIVANHQVSVEPEPRDELFVGDRSA